MKKSAIKSIELEVGGKTLKLSPSEAKELYQALGELISEPCNRPHTWWGWNSYPAYSTGNLNVPNMGLTSTGTVDSTTTGMGDNWSYTHSGATSNFELDASGNILAN